MQTHVEDQMRHYGRRLVVHIRLINILMTNFVEDFIRGTSTADTHSGEKSYLEPNKTSYCDPSIAGGGQIYTQVSHVAAYLTYLTDQRPASVFAEFDNAGAPSDLFNALTIRLEQGSLVSLGSAGAPMTTERNYEVRIFGDDGMILLELWKGTMSAHNRKDEVKELSPLGPDDIYPHEAPARLHVPKSGSLKVGNSSGRGRIPDDGRRSAHGPGGISG